MRQSRSAISALTVLTLAAARAPSVASAQQARPPDGWAVGVGAVLIHFTGFSGIENLRGPAVQLSLLRPRGIGIDFRVAYFVPTGLYDFTGLTSMVGVSVGVPSGEHLALIKGGVTGFIGGDSDGGGAAAIGPYVGAGIVVRLSGQAGLQVDGLVRMYSGPDFATTVAPSLGVALMVLPRRR